MSASRDDALVVDCRESEPQSVADQMEAAMGGDPAPGHYPPDTLLAYDTATHRWIELPPAASGTTALLWTDRGILAFGDGRLGALEVRRR